MPRTAVRRSPVRSFAPFEKPLPECGGEVRRLVGIEPRGVDFSDQSVQRTFPFPRRGLERLPEYRLETDRRLMSGDQHRALLGWSVIRLHQYMCWPPLIDSV